MNTIVRALRAAILAAALATAANSRSADVTTHSSQTMSEDANTATVVVPGREVLAASWDSFLSSMSVTDLLQMARATHEPEMYIVRAVRILDDSLARNPDDRSVWMKLAEALGLDGFPRESSHGSPATAWMRAYELDTADCHAGAQAVRWLPERVGDSLLWVLHDRFPDCAEILYLVALQSDTPDFDRVRLLEHSLRARQTGEARVRLGQTYIAMGRYAHAVAALDEAWTHPFLFPEDWRPDVWVEMHAHLGLAYASLQLGDKRAAREYYEVAAPIIAEPGPWHDFDEHEGKWLEDFRRRWPDAHE
jgi:tetratricopeptide (TPR) repeat protein